MSRPLRAALAATLLSLTTLSSFAAGEPATTRVDARQARQEHRIDQGIASGELTKKEAARLNAQQARIDTAENRAQADGKVSAKERARLEARQDRASRQIRHQKHDAQTRGQ
jgi:hypothetical protein